MVANGTRVPARLSSPASWERSQLSKETVGRFPGHGRVDIKAGTERKPEREYCAKGLNSYLLTYNLILGNMYTLITLKKMKT